MPALPRPLTALAFASLVLASGVAAAPWKIYLLFGQSNMAGSGAIPSGETFNNPRVKMLAYNTCNGKTYNEWYTATGGLHCGTGVGIGDWFAKVVADSLTQDTLALIPCAIAGVDIDFFRKGIVSTRRGEFRIPPDNADSTAYDYMVRRLKKAQEKGVVAGILLHQGESDWTAELRNAWQGKVTGIISDLKKDLSFGDVPVLIGELRADAAACCKPHNTVIAATAKAIPNGSVVSSANLPAAGDAYHFTAAGQMEFGKRYAAAYLKAPGLTAIDSPRKNFPSSWRWRQATDARTLEFTTAQDRIRVRDSRGRLLAEGSGRTLRLPGTKGHGLLFFQAQIGEMQTFGSWVDFH
jgi:Carbohydrate esterase, sialic acid-specific acetylesterase